MPTPRLFVEIAAESTSFQQALRGAENSIQSAGKNIQNVGRGISNAGGTLTRNVTLPLVGLGAAATKAAIDWESAFTGVRKTVDATDGELAQLENGLRGLALEIPISATELAQVAEAAGQLGIETGSILDFTKTMAMLGVTTNLSSDEAATALARFANITGMSTKDYGNLGSAIVALGNNMATTEAEIVSMALRLAGAGSTIGLSEQDILAMSAALSSVGISAEAGGTAMSRVMSEIAVAVAAGGNELDGFAKIAGMSAKDFAMAWERSPMGAMLDFVKGLRRMQDNGEDVFTALDDVGFGGIRVRDSLLRLAGGVELLGNAWKISAKEWANNTALSKEAELRFGTMESKLIGLKNQFMEMMITIGGPLIDALTAALVAIQPFLVVMSEWATKFAEADPATQQMILAIAGIVAAAGPLLSIIGNAIVVVGGLVTAFGAIPGIASTAGAAFGAIAAVLTGPLGVAIALIIGLVAAVALAWRNNWGDIQGKTAAVVEWFKTKLMPILRDIGDIIFFVARVALNVLGVAFRDLGLDVANAASALKTIFAPALDWISEKIQPILGFINQFAQGVRNIGMGMGGGSTISPQSMPAAPMGGASMTTNSVTGPLIGSMTVDSPQRVRDVENAVQEALLKSFDSSVASSNRWQYGSGAY